MLGVDCLIIYIMLSRVIGISRAPILLYSMYESERLFCYVVNGVGSNISTWGSKFGLA